jgi:hypothetical protein
MAIAHYDYAKQIPTVITQHMPSDLSDGIPAKVLREPIGDQAVMHTHNTFPSSAQKYHCPMWNLPGNPSLEPDDDTTIRPNAARYKATEKSYKLFAEAVLNRLERVEAP